MKSLEGSCDAKTHCDSQRTMQMEMARCSVKKEFVGGVKVKKERLDEQEVNQESLQKESMEMDDVLLQLKWEINEEMEQDTRPLSFDCVHAVRIKEEIAEEPHHHLQVLQMKPGNVGFPIQARAPAQSDDTAQGQRPAAPENALSAKRRRLTRRDWQKTMQMEMAPCSAKKERVSGVKIKQERLDDQEVKPERPQEESNEKDDLWLQVVHKEIKRRCSVDFESSSAATETATQTSAGDGGLFVSPQMAPEPSSCNLEEAPKSDGHKDSNSARRNSVGVFASQAATWVKQCLTFRSSQTWSPTRPCCPANFFLGSMTGRPSAPQTAAPACVLQLDGRGLRCLQRFHNKHRQDPATYKNEAEPSHPLPLALQTTPLDADLNTQDWKLRGLDCMKMWPWMRDLPTCVWAGRGWAFDENGLRRLPSTGGSAAMQGVELFESVGAAAVTSRGENAKESAVAGSARETAAPPEGQKASRFLRHNSVKQSGMLKVRWDKTLVAWKVEYPRLDPKGKKMGKTNRVFAVKKFLVPGRSEAEADAKALEAAKAFRAELVQQGVLSEPKPRDPNFTSEVPGVRWRKAEQKWLVEIPVKGASKRICGGVFTEKAAAEAKALELREQHGLERQVTAVSTLAELPVIHPKVPYPGVKWSRGEQQWHVQCRVGGANRNFRIRPKDHSEEELERSFNVAVAWRKKQEKERGKAAKPKEPPVKKQRK